MNHRIGPTTVRSVTNSDVTRSSHITATWTYSQTAESRLTHVDEFGKVCTYYMNYIASTENYTLESTLAPVLFHAPTPTRALQDQLISPP
jgi:hypothetical protein